MYLLFVLIQCLLVVFVNGDVDEPYTEMNIEGGDYDTVSFEDILTYVVPQENDTITVSIETPQVNNYNITWKITNSEGNPITFNSNQTTHNNIVQFKMWVEIPKNAESIEWFLVDSSSNRIVRKDFTKIIVLQKIEVASDDGTWGNSQKLAIENKIIEAKCRGDTSKDIQLDWVDTSGNLLIPSERIQIFMEETALLRRSYKSLYLNVTTDMKGVGCRVTNPTEGTTTEWYNFTVAYPPVPTVISEMASSSCTEFTYEFFCSVNAVFPEEVIILIQRL